MSQFEADRPRSARLVPMLTQLTTQPTAREVIQLSLAEAVSAFLVAIEPSELSSGDPSSALKRARREARRVRVLLSVFSPLLDANGSNDWGDELDAVVAELDRVWASQAVCDRFCHAPGQSKPPKGKRAKRKSAGKRTAGDIWSERVVSATEQRLSLDRVALHDLLTRPSTGNLLDCLVGVALDPSMAPQADDPAEEQLVSIVGKLWRQVERDAQKLPSFATLTAAESPVRAWRSVIEISESSERAWFAAAALEPVYGKQARKAAKQARRLHRLAGALIELRDLEAWLSQVAERAHGQTAFAAGAMATSVWRDAKSLPKKWKAARRPGFFETPEWLR